MTSSKLSGLRDNFGTVSLRPLQDFNFNFPASTAHFARHPNRALGMPVIVLGNGKVGSLLD